MSIAKTFRRRLLAAAVPVTKWIGRAHAPWTHKLVCGLHCELAAERLRPGDVLMSRTNGELTNLFIPGFWTHGAVYAGDAWVVEAVSAGVVKTRLVTFMMRKDFVRAVRPLFATPAAAAAAGAWCLDQVGRGAYDFEFTMGNEAFYCFELTYAAYRAACGVETPWRLDARTMGVPTVVGDDFDRSGKWRGVFDVRDWVETRVDGEEALAITPNRRIA